MVRITDGMVVSLRGVHGAHCGGGIRGDTTLLPMETMENDEIERCARFVNISHVDFLLL